MAQKCLNHANIDILLEEVGGETAAYSELGISGIIPSAGLFRLRLGVTLFSFIINKLWRTID
jgi:hypothetical protein